MALSKIDIENMVTGELTTTNGGTGATSFTPGITMADHWYKNSNATGNQNPITGWARMANTGQGGINAGMTESSGTFTFPSTGIYYIVYDCLTGTTQDQTNMWSYITVGADNTSTNYLSVMASSGDSGTMNTVTHSAMLDVTNTSNQKVFLRGYAGSTGSYVSGNANLQRSAVTFIRLGDT